MFNPVLRTNYLATLIKRKLETNMNEEKLKQLSEELEILLDSYKDMTEARIFGPQDIIDLVEKCLTTQT